MDKLNVEFAKEFIESASRVLWKQINDDLKVADEKSLRPTSEQRVLRALLTLHYKQVELEKKIEKQEAK